MIIIGLTGGIGSGKSTIAQFFKNLGVPVYIADDEAKLLMHTEVLKKQIAQLFGKDAYLNDKLNRKYIANLVFKNEELLRKLNAIVHPAVGNHFMNWASKQKSDYVIKEAAILFENGGNETCDATILVTAPEDVRVARVTKRDNVKAEEVKNRMSQQWSDAKKIDLADYVIHNTDLKKTENDVKEIHNKILQTLVNR
ncbi:MAG: dephospho-CoA kinase [Leeuwenhoekiella sp.]